MGPDLFYKSALATIGDAVNLNMHLLSLSSLLASPYLITSWSHLILSYLILSYLSHWGKRTIFCHNASHVQVSWWLCHDLCHRSLTQLHCDVAADHCCHENPSASSSFAASEPRPSLLLSDLQRVQQDTWHRWVQSRWDAERSPQLSCSAFKRLCANIYNLLVMWMNMYLVCSTQKFTIYFEKSQYQQTSCWEK